MAGAGAVLAVAGPPVWSGKGVINSSSPSPSSPPVICGSVISWGFSGSWSTYQAARKKTGTARIGGINMRTAPLGLTLRLPCKAKTLIALSITSRIGLASAGAIGPATTSASRL